MDLPRTITCGLLLAVGCGKPAAVPDAPGPTVDGAGIPDHGPDDAAGSPGPGDAYVTDAHMADARMADARMADARMADALAADARLLDASPLVDAPGHPPGTPGLGAHAMAFYHLAMSNATSISTPAIATQPSGSMIVVGVGRGDNTLFALPTDNKGNTPYRQRDIMHPYAHPFEASGTALYEFTSAVGGTGFQVSTTTGPDHVSGQSDEITVAAVEVVNGSQIQQVWNVVVQQTPAIQVTSGNITTTGPATLIAFWWGDAFPNTPQSATPNNGFTLIDTNAQETNSFVQCAVAAKNVTAAGTYNVTWTSTPVQGAQLWLVAVQ